MPGLLGPLAVRVLVEQVVCRVDGAAEVVPAEEAVERVWATKSDELRVEVVDHCLDAAVRQIEPHGVAFARIIGQAEGSLESFHRVRLP